MLSSVTTGLFHEMGAENRDIGGFEGTFRGKVRGTAGMGGMYAAQRDDYKEGDCRRRFSDGEKRGDRGGDGEEAGRRRGVFYAADLPGISEYGGSAGGGAGAGDPFF